ncbi:OLC1v1027559C1 [Oldenlandia corymbosa var. corymbosa]|uniref:OLC1v1027559C1 n=1 Tax=Oldenlandia corymbosa var. corymbosa TaxID=529605 RepID=A0AAV1CC13_OLDCO|nr:OLC1v1027559C1 [Oldenlandia corymbosa var. corymbosa]
MEFIKSDETQRRVQTLLSCPSSEVNPPDPAQYDLPEPSSSGIPLFPGENVTDWLDRIERFFFDNRVSPHWKLFTSSFYMAGEPLRILYGLTYVSQLSTWEEFAYQLELRFGKYIQPTERINVWEASIEEVPVTDPSFEECIRCKLALEDDEGANPPVEESAEISADVLQVLDSEMKELDENGNISLLSYKKCYFRVLVHDSEKLNGADNKGKHRNLFAIEPGGMINSCFGKIISKSMLSVNDDVNFSLECVGVTCMNSEGNEVTGEESVVSVAFLLLNDDELLKVLNAGIVNHVPVDSLMSNDSNVDTGMVKFDSCPDDSGNLKVDTPAYLNEENDHVILDLIDGEVTLELSNWSVDSSSLNDSVNDACSKLNHNSLKLDGVSADKSSFDRVKCWKYIESPIFVKVSFIDDPGGLLFDDDAGLTAKLNSCTVSCVKKVPLFSNIMGVVYGTKGKAAIVFNQLVGNNKESDCVTDGEKNRHFNLGIRLNRFTMEPGDSFSVNNLIRRIPRGCFVFGAVSSRFNGARLGDDDRVTKSWPEVSTGFQGGTDLRRSTISVDLILDDKIFLAWRKLPNNNFKGGTTILYPFYSMKEKSFVSHLLQLIKSEFANDNEFNDFSNIGEGIDVVFSTGTQLSFFLIDPGNIKSYEIKASIRCYRSVQENEDDVPVTKWNYFMNTIPGLLVKSYKQHGPEVNSSQAANLLSAEAPPGYVLLTKEEG